MTEALQTLSEAPVAVAVAAVAVPVAAVAAHWGRCAGEKSGGDASSEWSGEYTSGDADKPAL